MYLYSNILISSLFPPIHKVYKTICVTLLLRKSQSLWVKIWAEKHEQMCCAGMYACAVQSEACTLMSSSWMRPHSCPRRGKPLLWGLQASGHQRDAPTQSNSGRDSPSPPRRSSITPLFWVMPFSLDWLGTISFLHKKLCKSFHPLWWVLAPLIWVDILICCQKTERPAPTGIESWCAKTHTGTIIEQKRKSAEYLNWVPSVFMVHVCKR